jgi:hypothetical protein
MHLAWSPLPATGVLFAVVDGARPLTYAVEGSETMGNGSPVAAGPAALDLAPRAPMPKQTLRIVGPFPNESVEFPFAELPPDARQSLAACFPGV